MVIQGPTPEGWRRAIDRLREVQRQSSIVLQEATETLVDVVRDVTHYDEVAEDVTRHIGNIRKRISDPTSSDEERYGHTRSGKRFRGPEPSGDSDPGNYEPRTDPIEEFYDPVLDSIIAGMSSSDANPSRAPHHVNSMSRDSSYYMDVSSSGETHRSFSNHQGTPDPDMPSFSRNVSIGRKAGTNYTIGTEEEVPVHTPPPKIAKTIPDHFTVMLPYHSLVSLDIPQSSKVSSHQLNLNNIVLPEQTGGHQPMGHDLWITVFKYYRVLACNVRATFHSRQFHLRTGDVTTINEYLIAGMRATDDPSTSFADRDTFYETKHMQTSMLSPASFDGSVKTLNFNYSPERWTSHVKEQGTAERWTPVGASPPNLHHLMLYVYNANDTAAASAKAGALVDLQMDFTVQFKEEQEIQITQGD